ncbi:nodulation protein NodH [Sulfitobacter sp. KE29]|uniref:nodulation protein NodH n=1 Tax=unclassified Sulfitobacter TaxID=196795 RepID=UPI0007C3F12E|nr:MULTISPECIES: nodulation protein NodH [unclassified Sulfitobacter]KZY52149.1 nodulation protein NodH [Sulfitobacter sp. HI0054]MBO9439208.1 nodulation protein NodH [Sulfitobacter sp. R18_2]MDF3417403.1 nodulation protein NodH [Sulfitobacter sp. Ks38]MDF3424885.1 nodulation protein NodH [Sulfitobacter sp. KE29]MDF3428466.1 nodulation protein NodH [Sulfitobacter sp. S46]
MRDKFDSFVVFAEMRTGSNFLEANLNAFAGIACHGEAFNPFFMGYPKSEPILGVDQVTRDENPTKLLAAIRGQQNALGGFRYFHDHDPRVFDEIVEDQRCAKIVLTRNPVDSYVSWKIAQATGQWKLTDMKAQKVAQAVFDADEFSAHLDALQQFQITLLNRLQTSGQTAFYVAYEDLQSVEVMNGLARYLGVDEQLEGLDKNLKKQNPSPISAKVSNYDEMLEALARLDRFDLTRTPNFEPRRGPNVPSYVAAATSGLIYLPIKSGPQDQVLDWLAALDGVPREALRDKMSQKELRQWKRKMRGHRGFTVLRHPALRAHDAFCRHILTTGEGSYRQLRNTLMRRYKVPLPKDGPDAEYDREAHRAAFVAFLKFLKGNLAGQTSIRVDAAWCSQAQAIAGFGAFCLPDRILREEELASELPALAAGQGHATVPAVPQMVEPGPFTLGDIYDDEIEALTAEAYQKDYMTFGFSRWR